MLNKTLQNEEVVLLPIEQMTKENIFVSDEDKGKFIVRLESVSFSPTTGEKLSRPQLQTFEQREFRNYVLHNLQQQGFKVEILYDPTEVKEGSKRGRKAKEQ